MKKKMLTRYSDNILDLSSITDYALDWLKVTSGTSTRTHSDVVLVSSRNSFGFRKTNPKFNKVITSQQFPSCLCDLCSCALYTSCTTKRIVSYIFFSPSTKFSRTQKYRLICIPVYHRFHRILL